MLESSRSDKILAESKLKAAQDICKVAKENLERVNEKISSCPALQKEQQLREEYLEIKSRLQTEHTQIEKETSKLNIQINQATQKQIAALNDLCKIEKQISTQSQIPQI